MTRLDHAPALSNGEKNFMHFARLVWTGVSCCLAALALNLFPTALTDLGIDTGAIRAFFAFGLFLIVAGLALAAKSGGR
jgi:hypothetical protein